MIGVHFSKDFAEKVLDAIKAGKPIPAPAEGWTGNRMLSLAGILYAAVFSQGPHTFQLDPSGQAKLKKLHPEMREAVEDTFNQDIHDGIEFLSNLTFGVIDGEYDEDHEPELNAVLYQQEDGSKTFVPGKGFKKFKNTLS